MYDIDEQQIYLVVSNIFCTFAKNSNAIHHLRDIKI